MFEIRANQNLTLEELKRELGPHLRRVEQVMPPKGVATGWSKLDHFLLWHGFPKSAVSLMVSEAGGATSLWSRSAIEITRQGRWVGWINDAESDLAPWVLKHRGADLSRLLYVSPPRDAKQLLWALQELMSLGLFEMIGCDLGNLRLKEHQILKLKKLALRYQCAVVLISRDPRILCSSVYSLILHFEAERVRVSRALHRPTPFCLERKDLYADTLPVLAAGNDALSGRTFFAF